MTHLVRHRTAEGDTVTTEVDDLGSAVALVERLRNDDLAEHVHVYAEVPLRFETYVRVSVADERAGDTAPSGDGAPDTPAAPTAEASSEPAAPSAPVPPPPGVLAPVRVEAPSADAEELAEAGSGEGRRGLFHRG